MPGRLYTIGYGNQQPEAFFARIPSGVRLVDVRDVPRGWSIEYSAERMRKRFAFTVPDGRRYTMYRHDKPLGNPTRCPDGWPQGETPDAQAVLQRLAGMLRSGQSIVLLCAEADWRKCHRRLVAEALLGLVEGIAVEHL